MDTLDATRINIPKQPMKIAMIGQKGIPAVHGGIETHVDNLSTRLSERGQDITVYSREWYCNSKNDFEGSAKRVFTPNINTKHLDTITHTFTSTIHAVLDDFDIIHYHGVGPSLLAWIPRVFSPDTRVVSTFHCIDRKHGKWSWFAKLALRVGEWASCRFAHKTISVSRGIQTYAKKAYEAKTEYIPNAVALQEKTSQTDKIEKWGLKNNDYILIVSRLIEHKGIHYAIKAFRKLKQQNEQLLKNKKLVIVGGGHYSESYVEKIKGMAEMDEDIILTGFQKGETLKQLFSHAYLLINPSENEGLPTVVLEGMSFGLPCLVSDIAEHREIIRNSEYRFESEDIENLKENLEKILKKDKKELSSQAEKNRQTIERKYSWDNIVKEIEQLYERIQRTEIRMSVNG